MSRRRPREETLLRLGTVAGLTSLVAIAWLWLMRAGHSLSEMGGMGMAPGPWTQADVNVAVVMWSVMMIAMMLPSAAPMILTFITVQKTSAATGGAVRVVIFIAGYLAAWTAFSVAASLGEWALRSSALLVDPGPRPTPALGAAVLVVAGVYQLTPFKYACLARCQSPLGFLLGEWREGAGGALLMGLRHGLFCLGCCWSLMGLLFAGGVMNLLWAAALAAFVLAEKLLPGGRLVSLVSGPLLIAWGLWTLREGA